MSWRAIKEPTGNTCPDIDSAIKELDTLRSEVTDSTCDAILNYLEDLREANSKLRAWGEECNDEIEKMEEEISYLENRVSELED